MPIFVKGNFLFPEDIYLVFIFGREKWVSRSNDIKYLDAEKKNFEISKFVDVDLCDDKNLTLKVSGKIINNVRWFNVVRSEDGKYRIKSQHKSVPKIPWFKYLGSLFPILGCFFLYGKNKQLKEVIDNLDFAQSELSKVYKYLKYGEDSLSKESSQLFANKNDMDIAQRLRSKYGSWEFIEKQLTKSQEKSYKCECETLREKVYRLGDDNCASAIDLIDQYGKLENIKSKLINLETELKQNKKILGSIGSSEDIANVLKLKEMGSYKGILESLTKKKLLDQKIVSLGGDGGLDSAISLKQDYGSFSIIKEHLVNFSNLTKTYGEISRIEESFDQSRKLKESYKKLEEEVSLLGTSHDRRHALDLKGHYGNFEIIQQKIKRWEEIEQQNLLLENKNQELSERERRWLILSQGRTLEQLEQKIKTKESSNPTLAGGQLETRIRNILDEVSASNYSTDDSFRVESEYKFPKTNKRVDFWVQLSNEKNKYEFSIALECKLSQDDDKFFLELKSDQDIKQKISSWLKQLCEYYRIGNAQLGILVTNIDVYDLEKKKIKMMKSRDLPDGYKESRMNILLVHESVLGALVYIIKVIHANYVPELKPEFSISDTVESFSDREIRHIYEDLRAFIAVSAKDYESIIKKVEGANTETRRALKYLNSINEKFKQTIDRVENHLHVNYDVWKKGENLLEGSNTIILEEEEED